MISRGKNALPNAVGVSLGANPQSVSGVLS